MGFLEADSDVGPVFTINTPLHPHSNAAKQYKDAAISVSLRMEKPPKQHLDHHVTVKLSGTK